MSVVIIGAGHAGVNVAFSLRKRKYSKPIYVLGDEREIPYSRPPLSKSTLIAELPKPEFLYGEEAYKDKDILLHLDAAVSKIDLENNKVFVKGEAFSFDHLILATGAAPRTLNICGSKLDGVFSIKTFQDAQRFSEGITDAKRLLVIGAGYVGLEVAAALNREGVNVCVTEAGERCMARTASPELSNYVESLHTKNGIEFRFSAQVDEIIGENGHVSGARLKSGELIQTDAIIVAIGSEPNTDLAEDIGLEVDRGILTKNDTCTSISNVYAIGDCARAALDDNAAIRLESIHNAIETADICAANITQQELPIKETPWFWSDQLPYNLKMVGITSDKSERLIRYDMDKKSYAVFHFADGKLLAAETVDMPRAYMFARKVMRSELSVKRELVSSLDVDFKDLIVAS
ncbi:NAD(P)/FAD-dependent oxidoreductase [Hirschia baltica]|uniref:FAD-dependent pyridine nucleotide-disulphide oxidoreductase n=1 Tax=Hirschia baltica (strain ATCC 49814 / DSM 5838 / IFAM 1418) TaxID=582402 RepID=C6XNX8_HIRBI|nr:FAD-dependent oxidoreductase [Hirschia baltica]ACT60158.1 FAD-dependent pyridine nucleotide-disulphide oxidoreductase [Hirschia baltica ATCC 49814]